MEIEKPAASAPHPLETAASLVGGRPELALLLGVSVSAIGNWKFRGVPFEQCMPIERATLGKISRRELRPDDWSQMWPELAVAQPEPAQAAIELIASGAAAITKLEATAEDQVAQVALDARVEIAKLAALAENQINAAARAPREVWSHERREAERLSRLAAGAVGTPVELSAKEA